MLTIHVIRLILLIVQEDFNHSKKKKKKAWLGLGVAGLPDSAISAWL